MAGLTVGGPLILSIFPGIDLLGMAFELEWPEACVVRGPDLLWGGDIKTFHPPAGKFDGVIGGPPCQPFSRLVHIVRANGYRVAENLIPEFERCVLEAMPRWFLMENVEDAPVPQVWGYFTTQQIVRDVWVGGETDRKRRFTFGWFQAIVPLLVEWKALYTLTPKRAVVCDARETPVKLLKGGRPKGGGTMPHAGKVLSVAEMASRQGLPSSFLDGAPFSVNGKRKMIGNAVPIPMGRAIAKAVKRALALAPATEPR